MKHLFLLFGLFVSGISLFAQDDSIFATVEGNAVTIWHTNVNRNCGSMYDMQYLLNDYHLFVYEKDTGAMAFCYCYFDLSLTIDSLSTGNYDVDVYGINFGNDTIADDTVYYGSTGFSITAGQGMPFRLASYQSTCQSSSIEETPHGNGNALLIFPNPVTDKVSIRLPKNPTAKSGHFDIYDAYGRQVATSVFNSDVPQSIEWNAKDLVPGVYFCRFRCGSGYFYGKFIAGGTER
jgi:hypothetical protein